MRYFAEVYMWLVLIVGTIAAFSGALYGLGWALSKLFKRLQEWHILMLLLAVKMHGRDYKDRLFWEAVKEHIGDSAFAAKTVSDFARRCKPFTEDEPI